MKKSILDYYPANNKGYIVANSPREANKIVDAMVDLNDYSTLYLNFNNWSQLFSGKTYNDLSKLELKGHTDNITSLFDGCEVLEYAPKITIDNSTNMVTEARYAFRDCYLLEELPYISRLSSNNPPWNAVGMCENCESLKVIKCYGLVGNFTSAFAGCISLKTVDCSFKFTEERWVDMSLGSIARIFEGCTKLTKADIDVANMDTAYAFNGCTSLKSVSGIISSTNCKGMFQGCSKLSDISNTEFDLLNCRNIEGMFNGCKSLKNIPRMRINPYVDVGNWNDFWPNISIEQVKNAGSIIELLAKGYLDDTKKYFSRF